MRGRLFSLVMTGAAIVLGACGRSEVVVQAQLEGEGGEPTPLANFVVRALPYDRDVIFDSLKAAATTPEPAIPDSLKQMQAQIDSAQSEWRQAEARWTTARDSLAQITTQMSGLSPRSVEYRLLFTDFGDQESRAATAKRQMDQAFARFDTLQKSFTSQTEQLRVQRQMWGDEAYASVDSIIEVRLDELGREELADTTNANGMGRFISVKAGLWWVHARHDLPFEELYWNVPIEVQGGDPIQVILNRSNAQVRPRFF